jgi:hypothetical protein
MDPISAVGVAAAALQFAQFSGALHKSSVDIRRSASGIPREFETLEAMDHRLSEFCEQLKDDCLTQEVQQFARLSIPPPASTAALSLKSLCSDCHRDCSQLLEIVKQVRRRGSGESGVEPLKCVRVAIASVLKRKEVDDLQRRIDAYQGLIVLHLITFTK